MTTAHRATYKSAKATYNGIEQGNYYTGGVGTNAVAARDLPGQKTLKRRLEGQGTEEELGAKDFKKILEEKEAQHESKRLKMLDDFDDSDDEVDDDDDNNNNKTTTKMLNDTSNNNINNNNNNNNNNEDDDDSSSDDDSSDDDDEALMLELEKIRKEKEMEKKKEISQGNPLLNNNNNNISSSSSSSSNKMTSRWDDDVVFKNQARSTLNKDKPGFINDTTKNNFHRKFMDKYIK